MIDHCISLFRKEQEERAYKLYCAECLRIIGENVAKVSGGSYISAKFSEIIEPKRTDSRTPEQIIEGLRAKIQQ